jgi:hypothetical protein
LNLPATISRSYEHYPSATTTVREMSSGLVVFDADSTFLLEERVKLSIAWPAKHCMGAALQLRIEGAVVKTEGTRCEVEILAHEFRIARSEWQLEASSQIEGSGIRPTAATVLH